MLLPVVGIPFPVSEIIDHPQKKLQLHGFRAAADLGPDLFKSDVRLESARRLKEIRLGRNQSQEKFAEMLNISVSAYKKMESGENNHITNPDTFEKEYGSFFHLPIISYIDIVTVYIYFINILCNYMEHFN